MSRRNLSPLVCVLCLAAFILGVPCSARALDVRGDVSGVWTPSLNPYVVRGVCRVTGETGLVIRPGVQVLFEPGASLVVVTRLTAEGNPANPVRFASLDAAGPWNAIIVPSTGRATLTSCVIEGGGGLESSDDNTGVVRVEGGWLSMRDCDVSGSVSSGLYVQGGSASITASRFENNGGRHPTDAAVHVVSGAVSFGRGADANSIMGGVYGVYNANILPIDATGTWWGADNGPQHPDNVLGEGCSVSDDVQFANFVIVAPRPRKGDVNRDGRVDIADVKALTMMVGGLASGPAPEGVSAADVTADGALNLLDATRLMQMVSQSQPL